MKYYNVKATTELYNTHLRHCLRAVIRTDKYDDFFTALLEEVGELKHIMRDVQESKINTVKLNSFLSFIDPTHYMDMKTVQSIYFSFVLSNRNFKNYRSIVEDCISKYLDFELKELKKSLSVTIKYAQNKVILDDCLSYVLHFALGSELNIQSEMPCIELLSGDKSTQLVFNVINHVLLRENYYPLGLNEFLQILDYLNSLTDLYIYTSYNSIDVEPYKSKRFDDIPMSLVNISDFEKNIIDSTFITATRASLEHVSYDDAISLQNTIRNVKSVLVNAFEETCRLFMYTYSISADELKQLSNAFSINPMTFTYLALLKHKCTEYAHGTNIVMSIHNCVDLLKQSAISQFSMTEHLITMYESDILIKQLCAQVCDSSDINIKELRATYLTSIENKDNMIAELTAELVEVKTKMSNYTTKDISQKETIDSLKQEIVALKARILELEGECNFYKAIMDSEMRESELLQIESSKYTLECLGDVLADYPNTKIVVVTRNSNVLSNYDNFHNIKAVNAWSNQFDTSPVKEADIVIINTTQLDHSVTYRVKSAISSNSKIFFTRNSNLTILNNYIIGLVKTHGKKQ